LTRSARPPRRAEAHVTRRVGQAVRRHVAFRAWHALTDARGRARGDIADVGRHAVRLELAHHTGAIRGAPRLTHAAVAHQARGATPGHVAGHPGGALADPRDAREARLAAIRSAARDPHAALTDSRVARETRLALRGT